MRRRRGGRKVSVGTVVTLALTLVVLGGTLHLLAQLSGGLRPDTTRVLEALRLGEGLQPLSTSDIPIAQGAIVPVVTPTPQAAPAGGLVQLFGRATATPAPGATATPTAVPTEAPPQSLTVTAGGITAVEKTVRQSGYYAAVDSYDLTDVFSLIAREVSDSLSFVTLENLVVPTAAMSDLIAPEEVMGMLSAGGLDMVALGFARAYEYGYDGINTTLLAAESAGLEAIGAYRTEQLAAAESHILTENGVKVALLHVTDGLTTKSKNNLKKDGRTWAIATADTAAAQIAAARAAGAQAVIVSVHWGTEGKTSPTAAQKKLAQSLADAGADVIIGAGTRRVQQVLWLDSADGRRTLCAYDLGCLISDSRAAGALAGMLLRFELTCDAAGQVTVHDVTCIPTYLWRYQLDGAYTYRLLASDRPAPDGMVEADVKAMAKALEAVRKVMDGGAAALRGEETP